MPRSRNVKIGFFESEQIGTIEPCARLLFVALWQLAGADGRLEERAARIKAYAFRFDACSVADVERWLEQLVSNQLIERYAVGGTRIISILKFAEHQAPDYREPPSGLPGPEAATSRPAVTGGVAATPSVAPTPTLPPPAPQNEVTPRDVDGELAPVADKSKRPKQRTEISSGDENSFEQFWALYPRKEGKEDARKKFAAAAKSPAAAAAILTGLRAALPKLLRAEPTYRPHAKTWLNNKRWEDEHTPDPDPPQARSGFPPARIEDQARPFNLPPEDVARWPSFQELCNRTPEAAESE